MIVCWIWVHFLPSSQAVLYFTGEALEDDVSNTAMSDMVLLYSYSKLITNWWAWELVLSKVVGGPAKVHGTAGRFHGNLREPALQAAANQHHHTEGTSVEKLPNPISTVTRLLWRVGRAMRWVSKIGDQSSDPQRSTEQANSKTCKIQQSRQLQLWRLELLRRHMARQALAANLLDASCALELKWDQKPV